MAGLWPMCMQYQPAATEQWSSSHYLACTLQGEVVLHLPAASCMVTVALLLWPTVHTGAI